MRFYRGKLEEVKIHAAGKTCIYTAFKAVEVLTRYGYADIGGIRTSKLEKEDGRSISKVEILLKKTPDFEKIFEDFEKSKSQRDRGVPSTARAKTSPRQRGQASPTQLPQKEEIKESAPPQLNTLWRRPSRRQPLRSLMSCSFWRQQARQRKRQLRSHHPSTSPTLWRLSVSPALWRNLRSSARSPPYTGEGSKTHLSDSVSTLRSQLLA
jgi:hypothetical protein